ncbi:vacuolar proton translocating ATPase [Tritrichomonas foetus]|uniref:V-type proton ATPase subunit a n=1 Tax=Tritrichomonas foetus TaxID=1144522 RepID=A0A1J4JQL9_9EUKA|nr:vacuolar proton translocating ATPase [Tritrichomonas foetus]|eukprot:OHS99532.1 vacuolar proton translocating ATPase [Tritrichomonas foetus]
MSEKKELSSIFFPEPMDYVEFVCPIDSAYNLIKELAKKSIVQIEDHSEGNYSTPKRYADTYMQCEEAERSLRFIEEQLRNAKKEDGSPMLPRAPDFQAYTRRHNNLDLSDLLHQISEDDNNLHSKVSIYQQLVAQLRQRKRKLQALEFYRPIVEQEHIDQDRRTSEASAVELSMLNETQIVSSVTGFVPVESLHRLLTTVYRVSRRNVIYHLGESDGFFIPYVIFASSATVLTKIQKICESFSPDVFDFPGDPNTLQQLEDELKAEIQQMEGVDRQTRQINVEYLTNLAGTFWQRRLFIAQEKQIWMTMDYGDFDSAESSVIYRGWCARRLLPELPEVLSKATQNSGSPVEIQLNHTTAEEKVKNSTSEVVPPTFIEKNEFTAAFQMLNDAYGVPNYDELNGGAFYCIYPFLFAIMFGDIGHSIFYILAAVGLLFLDPIAKRKKWDLGEMGGSVFKFKWLLFFAAVCSLYCGFIYDECFGLPIAFFRSGWELGTTTESVQIWKQTNDSHVYPFGIDPCWYFKDNELIFLNSYKMKLSVVIGMIQMIFGMILQLVNHIKRKDVYEIIVKWLPEMLYLVPFFGYLVVIIIKKWTIKFSDNDFYIEDIQQNGVNLIQVMIGMILNLGSSSDKTLELYDGCWNVQFIIVIIFFVSIPYLLFVKPICECIKIKKRGEEINVLEIFVMNLINVIEFCLSALSHTASYLRLWALSLAHSQLSHVIYDELFVMTVDTNNVFLAFIGWAAFAAFTAAILLAMEAFSALLHAIRLMWVEFSSKFYTGMGVEFKPLSLKKAFKSIGVL